MAETTIKVNDNGPYAIKGDFELLDGEGNPMEPKKTIYLCRCGQSANKPFCDGSHAKVAFKSSVRAKQG